MIRVLLTTLAAAVVAISAEQAETPPAAGQANRPVMRTLPDPATPARVGVGVTQRRLTLEEALNLALGNNLDIDIQRTELSTAEEGVNAARGLFDPVFRWTPMYAETNTPTASVLQGAGGVLKDDSFVNNVLLQQRIQKWGTIGSLQFNSSRLTTTNPFANFNPSLTSNLFLNVTQPLLRGFRIDRERANIRISGRRVDLSRVDLEARVIDVISRVEQAYWDLVAAREAVGVAQDSVALAQEQLELNKRLVDAGTLAPVEIVAAEAEYQRRVDTLYAAIGTVTEVENNLKTLIAPEPTAPIWNDELIPTDLSLRPVDQFPDVQQAIKTAISQRPELRSIEVRGNINEVEKELNADLKKPAVNLVGQYQLGGLAGSISNIQNPFGDLNAPLYARLNQLSAAAGLQPVTPPDFGGAPPDFLIGGYGSTLANMFGGRYQSFQVGVSLDFNLRNRTADATYSQTLINEKRLRLERTRAEQVIAAQVRNSLQGIETARQRIEAAEASERAAKEKLESEIRLYQTGESTNFLVLTRQNDYADSRRRAVVARLDYNKSVARLQQALGTTLSTYKIVVQ